MGCFAGGERGDGECDFRTTSNECSGAARKTAGMGKAASVRLQEIESGQVARPRAPLKTERRRVRQRAGDSDGTPFARRIDEGGPVPSNRHAALQPADQTAVLAAQQGIEIAVGKRTAFLRNSWNWRMLFRRGSIEEEFKLAWRVGKQPMVSSLEAPLTPTLSPDGSVYSESENNCRGRGGVALAASGDRTLRHSLSPSLPPLASRPSPLTPL